LQQPQYQSLQSGEAAATSAATTVLSTTTTGELFCQTTAAE